MNSHTIIKWECEKCKDIVISDSTERHTMNTCKCGKTGIDLEEHYMRAHGYPKILEQKEIKNK